MSELRGVGYLALGGDRGPSAASGGGAELWLASLLAWPRSSSSSVREEPRPTLQLESCETQPQPAGNTQILQISDRSGAYGDYRIESEGH